jgi:hypothetical protein
MLVEILLCVVVALQSIMHYIERERLQDRIMSKSLSEYKARDKEPTQHHQSAHDRVLRKWRGDRE